MQDHSGRRRQEDLFIHRRLPIQARWRGGGRGREGRSYPSVLAQEEACRSPLPRHQDTDRQRPPQLGLERLSALIHVVDLAPWELSPDHLTIDHHLSIELHLG